MAPAHARPTAVPGERNATHGGQANPRASTAVVNGSLLSADDVAALLGMTKDWIYTETWAGRIPHVALGRYYRYRRESIDAWLQEIEHDIARPPWRASKTTLRG
jgi:excisionase family DNA binding protein